MSCSTALEGHFDLSPYARLSPEQQQFLTVFLQSRGIIKEVERTMGLSYPTVRNRLDALLQALGLTGSAKAQPLRWRIDILKDLESGSLTVTEALAELQASEPGGP